MRNLVIIDRAKLNIRQTFEFVEGKFGLEARIKLALKIAKVLRIAREYPEIFPISDYNKKIRKCVVVKQCAIYYHFNIENVVILSLFDTRQNPTKIKNIK